MPNTIQEPSRGDEINSFAGGVDAAASNSWKRFPQEIQYIFVTREVDVLERKIT